jgi:D-3-phosphoglycerate dehydrogenase
MGSILRRKKLGIIGYGEIGKEVGEICRGLVEDIKFYDPALKDQQFKEDYLELDQLLKDSDIISLHVPYTNETRHMIGAEQLKLMKTGSYLINCSRGGIVDEGALYQSLKDEHLAGAALDVFEQEPYHGPLKELDNVILTPHIGSYAREARIQMETEAVENLIRGLKG